MGGFIEELGKYVWTASGIVNITPMMHMFVGAAALSAGDRYTGSHHAAVLALLNKKHLSYKDVQEMGHISLAPRTQADVAEVEKEEQEICVASAVVTLPEA